MFANFFEKTREVKALKRKRETEETSKRNKQRSDLQFKSQFEAETSKKQDELIMCLRQCERIDQVVIEVLEKDENMFNDFIFGREMENFVIDKQGLKYGVKEKMLEL